jgi:surfeit locus 1 family protein
MAKTFQFWIITLSALAVAALTFALGLWQLDRASQKEKLQSERNAQTPRRLSGQWATDRTVYLDNRAMNTAGGQSMQGFVVVTPLMLSKTEYVLVQRGWFARDFQDRKHLQSFQTPVGVIDLLARRMAEPATPEIYANESDARYANEAPIVQYVKLSHFAQALPQALYRGMWQQIEPTPTVEANAVPMFTDGLRRNWTPPASGVEKHKAYAFQWFALSTLAVALYAWLQWIAPYYRQRSKPMASS